MDKLTYLALLSFLLFGCTVAERRPNHDLVIIDNSDLRKFEISLISNDLKPICAACLNPERLLQSKRYSV